MILSATLFLLAVICYSISQKAQHGQLRWSDPKKPLGFWGEDSDKRKYKIPLQPAPKNLYYKLVGSKYVERWFTSSWISVNFTDGYHASQGVMFIFLSGSLSIALELNFFIIWPTVLVTNFVSYRVLQRQ